MTLHHAPHFLKADNPGRGKSLAHPKLAVIITCWNYADYVVDAISSVVSQNRPDCELIVIDDGSTDRSWEVIQQTGVRAFRTENGGQRAACIQGLSLTSAPFVLFLDADDVLLPHSLDRVISSLDSTVSKLQFPLLRIDAEGQLISGPVPALKAYRDHHLARQVARCGVYTSSPTSGNVFRRDVAELIFQASYDKVVDGVILIAAPFMGKVVSMSDALGLYRVHGRNDSGLGNTLDPDRIQRNMHLFCTRLHHLRRILKQQGQQVDVVRAENTFYYREQEFYVAVARGHEVGAGKLIALVRALWGYEARIAQKIGMSCFFILTALLPKDKARRGLAYRLSPQERSSIGFMRAIC